MDSTKCAILTAILSVAALLTTALALANAPGVTGGLVVLSFVAVGVSHIVWGIVQKSELNAARLIARKKLAAYDQAETWILWEGHNSLA